VTLRSKLLLAQLPLALAVGVVGVVSRLVVVTLDRNAQGILKDNYLSVLAAEHMRDAADRLGRIAVDHVQGAAFGAAEVKRLRTGFERELAFQQGNITEAGEREMTEGLRARWLELGPRLDAVLSAPPAAARTRDMQSFEASWIAVDAATDEIATVNQDAMVRKSERARKSAEARSSAMVAVTLTALGLGVGVTVFLTNRLTRPLSILASAVQRLGQGDLDARARLVGGDEIARLAGDFNAMAERLSEYRRSSLGELLQVQEAAQAAIDSLPDPVLLIEIGGRLMNLNQAAQELFAISDESRQADPLAHADEAVRGTLEKLRAHVAAQKGAYVPVGFEEAIGISTREGTRFFLPRAMPVVNESGAVVALTALFQDVTRLRRFDELKNDLVATVAHEFRTPLTSLRMAIHMCLEEAAGPTTPKQGELLRAAREDCERLQTIVEDLLDLSRVQSGRLELDLHPVSSARLIRDALSAYAQTAAEKGVGLRAGAPTIDRLVLVDADRVQIVLGNLLSNAIRHTPKGGDVEVRAAPEEGAVRFEVRDTGEGIAREWFPRLFDRFFRIPGAAKGTGVGLGLYITKEIVEAHGGKIGVESEPGQGTIIWFTLPLAPRQSEVA
jgi:signal transduction histidine kinase